MSRTTVLGLTMSAVVALELSTAGSAVLSDVVGRGRTLVLAGMFGLVWAL